MKRFSRPAVAEPLESRIAPAVLSIGAPNRPDLVSDVEYRDIGPAGVFVFTDTSAKDDPLTAQPENLLGPANDQISQAVDVLGNADTFYVKLKAGDRVEVFTESNNYRDFITVSKGNVILFFTDLNGDNEYNDGELTGISLGAGVTMTIDGAVNGDILTNLNENKTTTNPADDVFELNSLVSAKQGIADLRVLGGSVFGSVLSGGDIKSISIPSGNVDAVLAGGAADTAQYDVFRVADINNPGGFLGPRFSVDVTVAAKQAGANISNGVFGSITERVEAGYGGLGGKGGSLTKIQVVDDSDGFALLAGAGGAADLGLKIKHGGVGGSVKQVYVTGVTDETPLSTPDYFLEDKSGPTGWGITIQAGDGGDAGLTGNGGAGGTMTTVRVGYELVGSKVNPSGELGADSVLIAAGLGGDGRNGGKGGAASDLQVRSVVPDDVNRNEIEVRGGDGGASLAKGKSGLGGSVFNLLLQNQRRPETPTDLTVLADTFVRAGDGGAGTAESTGAAGGSIYNVSLLGFDMGLTAGAGSDGARAGVGGSVRDITVARDELIIARNVSINAGAGGNGLVSNGANGGEVRNLLIGNSDIQSLSINTDLGAADGGDALGAKSGKGGKGGGVFNINVLDVDNPTLLSPIAGAVTVFSGDGGDGIRGGGAGGLMNTVSVGGNHFSIFAVSGSGGDATGKGKGGAAGSITSVQFSSGGESAGSYFDAELRSGLGGDGTGSGGAGGVGGEIRNSSVKNSGNATVEAGAGGSGAVTDLGLKIRGAAPGKGGSIFSSGAFSNFGDGSMIAGDAGVAGSKPAAGGSVVGQPSTKATDLLIGVRADQSILIQAGDGSSGGQGGDVVSITYGSTSATLTPTPAGDIRIIAGAGSGLGKTAGRGGNITELDGSISSTSGATTEILAGDGGSSPEATRGAAGGIIRGVTLARGGALDGVVRLEAGDAGDAGAARKGGAGGSIVDVGIFEVLPGTIVRSLAAGDGGDANSIRGTGGVGGSVDGVFVEGIDIGVRTGQVYGYDTMGGVFAGVGGAGIKEGLNGKASNVSAASISSIVAGRFGAPEMAEYVGDIYVEGTSRTLLFAPNAFIPNGEFILRYGDEETVVLPSGATVAQVQTALNSLPSIAAAGGVTVSFTGTRGYQILFKNLGARDMLSGIEFVPGDVFDAFPASRTPVEITTGEEGSIELPVVDVQSGVVDVKVTETIPGSRGLVIFETGSGSEFTNEVQVLRLGDLPATANAQLRFFFEGDSSGLLPATSSLAAIQGALNNIDPIALAGGVTVTAGSTSTEFLIRFNNVGSRGPITGLGFVPEVQTLDLLEIDSDPVGQFSLTYEGETTAVLPGSATSDDIENALNALSSVIAAGQVDVTSSGAGLFQIQFKSSGERRGITGLGEVAERQRLDLTSIADDPDATFTLNRGNDTTYALDPDATAIQIETALNELPTVKAAGGLKVIEVSENVFDLQFFAAGDQPEFVALGLRPEEQRIDLGGREDFPTGEFTLTVQNPLTVFESNAGFTQLPATTTEIIPGQLVYEVDTVTNGSQVSPEVQELDLSIVVANSGVFTLSFEGSSTTTLPASATAQQIEDALNKVDSVDNAGEVEVEVVGPNKYSITFNDDGDRSELLVTAFVRESQNLSLGALASDATGEYRLTYNGDDTVELPVGATAGEIEAALDVLPSIKAVGGVTVTPNGPDFTIRFDTIGARADILLAGGGEISHEHQVLDLNSLTGYKNASIRLTFDGEETATLRASASAAEIEAALNALSSVQETRSDGKGSVTVTALAPGRFDIEYNVFGDQELLDGGGAVSVDRYPVIVTETKAGSIGEIVTSTVRNGAFASAEILEVTRGTSTVQEVQRVELSGVTKGEFILSFGGQSTVALPVGVAPGEVELALNALSNVATAGSVKVATAAGGGYDVTFTNVGDKASLSAQLRQPEIQRVDLGALAAEPGGEFVLNLGGARTAPLPVNATPAQVEAALDAIGLVRTIGGTTGVTVTSPSAGVYEIQFDKVGNPPQITGSGGGTADREVQTLSIGALKTLPGGQFNLEFNGETTALIPGDATAAQVEAALNNLYAIKDLRLDRTGAVTVAELTPGEFTVTFNTAGDQPSIEGRSAVLTNRNLENKGTTDGSDGLTVGVVEKTAGSALLNEVQTIDLSAVVAAGPGAEFLLSFDNSVADTTYADTTVLLTAGASALDIEGALNALDTIAAAGGVTVSSAGGNTFDITFNSKGDQLALTGEGGAHEEQKIALGGLEAYNNGFFRLAYQGEYTRVLNQGASATEVESALNALASIRTLRANNEGSVSVSRTGAEFEIDFNELGNQTDLTGFGAVEVVPEIDQVETTQGADYPLPVVELRPGSSVTTTATEALPGDAVTKEQQVLDLSPISGVANSAFRLTFNGDTTVDLPRDAKPADIQAALNALNSVIAVGGVTVAAGAGNSIAVTFETAGSRSEIELTGGVREQQVIGTGLLDQDGLSEFTLTFNGETTFALLDTASATDVETQLNSLTTIMNAGGVVVSRSDAGFLVTFNVPGNALPITGSVSVYEQQLLDLQNLQSNPDAEFTLVFNGDSTPALPSNATAADIQAELNALPSIQNLAAGSGSVIVTELSPGVFRIDFGQAGDVTDITGTIDRFGTTERLPADATAEQIEAALDRVSTFDITVTTSAPGLFEVLYSTNGNQPTIEGSFIVHEQQRIDVLAGQLGLNIDFTITFNGETTTPLPTGATNDQVRNALNELAAVQAVGGIRDVVAGPDSSFFITFASDNDVDGLEVLQSLSPLPVQLLQDGTAGTRETQAVEFTAKNVFEQGFFSTANFVGAIFDNNEIDSNVFHFINLVGTASFEVGDMPIDGILMAKVFDRSKANFVPQASFTGDFGFYDHDNSIVS